MKIFAAGIATETNTFCPVPTSLEDFSVQRGRDVRAGRIEFPSLDLSRMWGERAKALGHEFVFSLMASARPSGTTVRSVYESLRDEVLNDLRDAMPVDIVLLMLHGAMVADGYDDCEEDLMTRIRAIVGPEAIIAAELDPHCHLRETTIAPANIVITYKEYPHVDVNARAEELFTLALDARVGRIRPTMALFDCRMIGIYPTSRQPLRAFVDELMAAEQRKDVLSISFGHGFHFGDVPHVGAKVLAITDNDPARAAQLAREYGMRVYGMRQQIGFENVSLGLEVALSRALGSPRAPVVVADQSDNTGGGGPGDATYALRWLLEHEATDVAIAIFYDPEVVRIAKKAGKGARLPIRLGGKMGPYSGDPLDLEVTVTAMIESYIYVLPQQSGPPFSYPIGDLVALRLDNGIELVVGTRRFQCSHPKVFTDLGIDLAGKRIIMPKSAQHFHGNFAPLAAEILYMAGPGAVPPDPRLVPYRRLDFSRLYPWAKDPLHGNS